MRRLPLALALALALGCQSRAPQPPADLIVTNGRVFPADGTATFHQAVAVRGDRIVLVGTAAEVDRLRGPKTEVIDAHGGAVVPGFNDPHFHPFLELESGPLNVVEATTLAGIQQSLRGWATAHPKDAWIVGQGWLYTAFPGGMPTRAQLDAAVPDRPVFLRSYDYHTAWVNSKALALAGITRATADPPGGIIGRDPTTGEPTGILKETAQGLFAAALPPITRQQRRDALAALVPKLSAAGITSVQAADSVPDDFDTYAWARDAGVLKVRVLSSITPSPLFMAAPVTDATVDQFDRVRAQYPADNVFRIGVIKLFADGVVEAFTAALLAPYSTRPSTTGMLAYPPQEFERLVTLLDRRGWPMMIHSIGDRAVRASLDAFQHAAAVNPATSFPKGRRHRVEHIETIDPADVPRFGAQGVIASMHPSGWNGAVLAESLIGIWAANLGPVRVARFGSWAPIAAAGGRVIIGSDWPAAEYDTVSRLYTVASPSAGAANGSAQLTMAAAVEAYTRGPAYAAFEEDVKGTLAPGMLADIVVLSADLFAQPLPPPATVSVSVTILGGRVVYRKGT